MSSDTITSFTVSGNEYYYFVASHTFAGTAFIGFSMHRFIFYNPDNDSLINLSYSKSEGKVGEYEVNDKDEIFFFKDFIALTSGFIKEQYGEQNLDLESIENFHTKWLTLNEGIYNSVSARKNKWVDIAFTKYNKSFFYDRLNNEANHSPLFNGAEYVAFAGFVNPILAFSKIEQKSYVLWIPQAWPNGSGWGARSYNIDNIVDNIIIASCWFDTLYFDMNRSKVLLHEN